MSQQGEGKQSLLDFYAQQIIESFLAYFMRILNSCVGLAWLDLANRGVRQTVQPHAFYAPLLVFDKSSAQPDFTVANCSDAVMSVFYFPILTRSLIFL